MPIRIIEKTSDRHPPSEKEKRAQRQKEYMEKHGPQQPRRKRLAVTDKYEEVRKKLKDPTGFKPLRASKQGGGRAGKQFGGRTNLLEELGRVEGEPSNRNRRAEISRVHGELNRGYKHGKRVKKAIGGVAKIGKEGIKRFLKFIKTGKDIDKHGTKINIDKVVKRLKKQGSPGIETYFESTGKHPKAKGKAAGGRIGLKHGGSAGAAKRGHGAEIK